MEISCESPSSKRSRFACRSRPAWSPRRPTAIITRRTTSSSSCTPTTGLVGLGEATVSALWSGETSKSCVAALDDLIGPALIGADPTQITALRKLMDFLIKLNPFTKAAVEMALWDIAGKALGVPVYQLLGGKVRDVIPTKMMIGAFDLPRVRSLAEQFLGWGVRCLKVKVGLDLAGDLARVQAVRERGGPGYPDHDRRQLRLERDDGADRARATAPVQPAGRRTADRAGRHRGDGLAPIGGGIPIMADESVFTLADAWNVLRAHAADVISIYPGQERRHRRGDRDRTRRPGRRDSLPCRQQPRAGHRLGGDAAPGLCGPEYRQRDLPGRHPRPALPRERPAQRSRWPSILTEPRCRTARAWASSLDEDQLRRFRVD